MRARSPAPTHLVLLGIGHEEVNLLRETSGALWASGLSEDFSGAALQVAPRHAIERGLPVIVHGDRRGGARVVEVIAEGIVPERRERGEGTSA